jgi:ribosomal protein S18 acetylase RimI-like enzyme
MTTTDRAAPTAEHGPGLVVRPCAGEADHPELVRIQNAEAALGVKRAWLDSVFTRRAWRRRGLARALMVRSFHLLRDRGMEVAALGVDAENPTGALGLYESLGFSVTERMTAWRRRLEMTS